VSHGIKRARQELERIQRAGDGDLAIAKWAVDKNGWATAICHVRIGPLETRAGGLKLREREEFVLFVPPDFPFRVPSLAVLHSRFAGFPHVIWSRTICLYQSKLEWNPTDGLFGFFDRLHLWLRKAALNEMDPMEGPLEPPHAVTDFNQIPFVIRTDAPVKAGNAWFGVAELIQHPNYTELIRWHDTLENVPAAAKIAVAIILSESLPMEFPQRGADLFAELGRQKVDKNEIVFNLALAALVTDEGQPIHLIIGLPMRRGADGTPKIHVAVWTTEPSLTKALRDTLPKKDEVEALREARGNLANAIYDLIAAGTIKWCQVLEDRPEIVVQRDHDTPASLLRGRKVLLLGCGALGSWMGEAVVRAHPERFDLVDNSIVKPGLLVRQNYRLPDIGASKTHALREHLRRIDNRVDIAAYNSEAFDFVTTDKARFRSYDLVLDCTASHLFQMKLEQGWRRIFAGKTPRIVSCMISATADQGVGVRIPANCRSSPWGTYIQLRRQLCIENRYPDIGAAFYSENAHKKLFQPEPGCSDPTFRGSCVDVAGLALNLLNIALRTSSTPQVPSGFILSNAQISPSGTFADIVALSAFRETIVGPYRVRIASSIYSEARAWARQNSRLRSPQHETGGLLWGIWDDAIEVIWIFALSGPPADSVHDPAHFICGVAGTAGEHLSRMQRSCGTCGFVGFWHTHPDMAAYQSNIDILGMAGLVAGRGDNQRRSLMLIFGRAGRRPTAGIYIYESSGSLERAELISVNEKHIGLPTAVV
jgi:hypothetical protein